ncbi:MAG: ATP-binding protein [Gammaproteobacteria bacterium]
MNDWVKVSEGVGRKLILSIGIILFFTVLSVYVSTIAIKKIEESQENLSNNSIPALSEVGHLSRVAVNIIQQSQSMSMATSIDILNQQMDDTFLLIESLLGYLIEIESYGLSDELVSEMEEMLEELRKNVIEMYSLVSEKIENEIIIKNEIEIMRNSIETIEGKVSLMKINADYKFLEKINEFELYNSESISAYLKNELSDIDLISSVIMRAGELRKDLNAINQSATNESVLLIQHAFNHSLRKIVRSIVQNKDIEFDQDVKSNIATLIEYGQDSPDVFDERKNIISISGRLDMISQENIIYTQKLNTAVISLANEVRFNAESASIKLHDTIVTSRSLLYVITFIALITSFLVSWGFIYKRIVVKLAELSLVTKKLSNNNFDFEIDVQGNDELSDIAVALESLREHSIKRISMNEALQKKSLKLKQSNEDLSQFAYIASHDLQEPLRMVGSYVQLLERKYENQFDDDAKTYINFAVDGCVRMKNLIEGLLEYSRVESSNEEFSEIDCNIIMEEIIQDLSVSIRESNADIIIDQLPNVYAVPSQLKMVFSNFINNALKYCEDENPRVEIRAAIVNDKIRFSISDNGIGIKPQYQKKIFIIFKRLHSRAEYSGTGIGLSICKKIIERHGGEVSLESAYGVGTTFFFTLPDRHSSSNVDEYKLAV